MEGAETLHMLVRLDSLLSYFSFLYWAFYSDDTKKIRDSLRIQA